MDPATQLASELQDEIFQALDTRRPILTHVNADTTWLVQIPWPSISASPNGRAFVNLLIDPWLAGPQSDVASWFSTQWHVIPSGIGTVKEMEGYLREVDDLARERRALLGERVPPRAPEAAAASHIDAVLISHEFTDHCHQATLLEVDPEVPVLANDKGVELVKSWNHFSHVSLLPAFQQGETDWRTTRVPQLPQWVGVSRIISPGNNLYYHSAVLVVADFNMSTKRNASQPEAVIYSPHGINAEDLSHLALAQPRIRTLALLHGLHDVSLTSRFQLNLGAHNGLKAARATRPRYWVASHDEQKRGGGIVARFLNRKMISLEEALAREQVGTDVAGTELGQVNFSELGSGESLLLI